jgi:putative hemolysin
MAGITVNPILECLVVLLLVLTAGGYTAAETAILTLLRASRAREKEPIEPDMLPELEETAREELPHVIERLVAHPGRLTTTIMLGRLVTRVLSVAATALLAFRWSVVTRAGNPWVWAVTGVVITVILLLVLAELLPRIIGTRKPNLALAWTIPLIGLSVLVFSPVTIAQTKLLHRFARGEHGQPAFLTLEELNRHLDAREDAGTLEADEREMIEEILEFGKTMVKEVMVPRIDMKAISVNDDYAEVRSIVGETGHSRLPVFDGDIDHVIGIMHVKDLLRHPEGESVPLRQLARKALFVPETKMIDDLLREFQQSRIHMAIVVDEYGGTSGMVTLEDLLEEIVGEIQDEYDSEAPLVRQIGPDHFMADAIVSLEDFEEMTGIELPEDGFDTLVGFLYALEGKVPEQGHVLEWEDLLFTIRETEGRRILKVEITRK